MRTSELLLLPTETLLHCPKTPEQTRSMKRNLLLLDVKLPAQLLNICQLAYGNQLENRDFQAQDGLDPGAPAASGRLRSSQEMARGSIRPHTGESGGTRGTPAVAATHSRTLADH